VTTPPSSPPLPSSTTPQRFFNNTRSLFRATSNQNLKNGTPQLPAARSRLNTPISDLNTLPDPRFSSPLQELSNRSVSAPEQGPYPDLSNEVATLSTKLINAINHQTDLDDNLQSTRHELVVARNRIQELEGRLKQHEDKVAKGVLVQRVETDAAIGRLRSSLAEEKELRTTAEKQKKGVEQEIENLTASLFEEANTMVSNARKENEQLRGQLKDSETIRAVLQEQLQDLKAVMERLQEENDLHDTSTNTPLTPTFYHSFDGSSGPLDEQNRSPRTATQQTVAADQPLKFPNLLRPILRDDLPAFDEFVTMVRAAARPQPTPTSRLGNSTFGSMNVMGALSNSSQSSITTSGQPVPQTPTSIVPGSFSSASSIAQNPIASPTPMSLPGSFNPSSPTALNLEFLPTLEKSKLYKRLLVDDIEPTLRLDAAPSLSWLARRTVVSSMVSGSLIVEPWQPGSRWHRPAEPCGLCGEFRRDDLHVRRHRFKTSESEDAARYPLCGYCLERVRATCELVGFLRLARNGHLKAETTEEAKVAWEDCTKLRERMFWARLGGGVIPVGAIAAQSQLLSDGRKSQDVTRRSQDVPRISREESPEAEAGAMEPIDVTAGPRPASSNSMVVHDKENMPVVERVPTDREDGTTESFSTPSTEQTKLPGGFDPSL